MITIRLFLLILVTLTCREMVSIQSSAGAAVAALSMFGICLGFGLLFKASALTVLMAHGEEGLWDVRRDLLAKCRQILQWIWLGCLPVTLLMTGWGASLAALEQHGLFSCLALLGWFIPSLAFIVLLELTAAQADSLLAEQIAEPSNWLEPFKHRLRSGELPALATGVIPVLLISLVNDAGGLFLTEESSPWMAGALMATALTLSIATMPIWMAWWFSAADTAPTDVRRRFECYQQRLNIGSVQLRMIGAQRQWCGAAIVGWFPYGRQLWLGEPLLEQLSSEEVDMVILHELAHVSRRHYLWRTLPVLAAAGGMAAVLAVFQSGLLPVALSVEAGKLLVAVVGTVSLLIGISIVARRCELDADAVACRLALQACDWCGENGGLRRAAHVLAQALGKLLDDPANAKATWLHPSLVARLENLVRHSVEPTAAKCSPATAGQQG